jgi:hypothetical protein
MAMPLLVAILFMAFAIAAVLFLGFWSLVIGLAVWIIVKLVKGISRGFSA